MSSQVAYENGRLTITKRFHAPITAVFNAWIETSKVELWWGCGYATQVKSNIEPKIGGKYHHLMTLTNVGEYQHYGLITEYEPPYLLAYQLAGHAGGETMMVRVEFSEQDAFTFVHLTQDNLPEAHSIYVKEGWSSAFEGLAYLLETGEVPRNRSLAH